MAIVTLNPVIRSIHGKMGDIVFVHRNGTQFIRRHVVPNDPKTKLQVKNRKAFADLIALWQKLPQNFKDSWNLYGKTSERTGYNLFISENMKIIRLGKSPELVKVRYLRVNEYGIHKSFHLNYKQLPLGNTIINAASVSINCEHSFYNRNVSYVQRE